MNFAHVDAYRRRIDSTINIVLGIIIIIIIIITR